MSHGWILNDLFDGDPDVCEASRVPISSTDELRSELQAFLQLQPRIVEFETPEGKLLRLGIGGPWAGLAVIEFDPSPVSGWPARMRMKIALASAPAPVERVEFLCGQQPCTLRATSLFPVKRMIELVADFFETGRFPTEIQWDTKG